MNKKFHIFMNHPRNILRTLLIVIGIFLMPQMFIKLLDLNQPWLVLAFWLIGIVAYVMGHRFYPNHWSSKGLKIGGLVDMLFCAGILVSEIHWLGGFENFLAVILHLLAPVVGVLGSIFTWEPCRSYD